MLSKRTALVSFVLLVFVMLVPLFAESDGAKEKSERPVEQELKLLTEEAIKQTPPELFEAGRQGLKELAESGVIESALNVGDSAPSFSLPNARGEIVKSADILAKGPMILVFYRGAWCPFCNLYLRSLREYVPEFKSFGASLVAISGEPVDRTIAVAETDSLNFEVLSDTALVSARGFGVAYELPKVIEDAVLKLGFDFKKYYNSSKAELPLSATYIVDKNGKIVYAFLEPDYKLRAEPADLIDVLKKLK